MIRKIFNSTKVAVMRKLGRGIIINLLIAIQLSQSTIFQMAY